MLDSLVDEEDGQTPMIVPIGCDSYAAWVAEQPADRRQWLAVSGFKPEPGACGLLPTAEGQLDAVLFCWDPGDPWCWAGLPARLPERTYRYATPLPPPLASWAALAWVLGSYGYTRYRAAPALARLVWPVAADRAHVHRTATAIALARDLINTPAADMGPADLQAAAAQLAARSGGKIAVLIGDQLSDAGYPMIRAVGAASTRAPRLIDVVWGREDAPKVTLVGKGVCFDSGGLDMKNSAGMKLMKKDMGGGAIALALASMIVEAALPVRLRLLIPAVDNAIAGNAFRPLDVLASRKGLTVEVTNTDAEGRLVLADALAEADRERPDLLIDIATLTGAARVALGPDITPFYTSHEGLAADLLAASDATAEPLWRLPLWKPYRRMLDSKVADICNAADNPHAGSITAALFLQEFVAPTTPWLHLDVFAWNPVSRPGRPEGGEATALCAMFELIVGRYAGFP